MLLMNKIYPNRKSARMIASDFRKATGNEMDPAFVHWLASKKGFQKHPYGKEVYYASNLRSLVDANYYTLYPVFLKEKEQKKLEREKSKEVDYNPNEFTEPDRKDYAWESKTNRRIMEAVDKTFRPTTEWMAEKYQEMNQWLFGGELMGCDFEVFTRGAGMEGSTLGWFCLCGQNLEVDKYGGYIYQKIDESNNVYVDRNNFVEICKPKIGLNGNYYGTEQAFLGTLVHEMCHYYTYIDGRSPRQAHGREFKYIGFVVSSRSNGMFDIQTLASAEEMRGFELSDEMKARKEKRLANKKNSMSAVFILTGSYFNGLVTTSDQNLIDKVYEEERKHGYDVVITKNPKVIEYLFNKGYTENKRLIKKKKYGITIETWKPYTITKKDWVNEIEPMIKEAGEQPQVAQPVQQQVQPQRPQPLVASPRIIFSIKTSNGIFETECSSFFELRLKLQQRFPNMSYDTITKLIKNKSNYKKIEENKMNTKSIIKEVIQEFIQNEFGGENDENGSIEITPNMNLGEFAPLEIPQ